MVEVGSFEVPIRKKSRVPGETLERNMDAKGSSFEGLGRKSCSKSLRGIHI